MKKNSSVSEAVLDHSESIIWAKEFVIRACVEEEWDELLKPPTAAEDFIFEFLKMMKKSLLSKKF